MRERAAWGYLGQEHKLGIPLWRSRLRIPRLGSLLWRVFDPWPGNLDAKKQERKRGRKEGRKKEME